ncbi:MAG: uracil-DNA glycosylase [Candidatus Geothermarchaeales archaeon]
MVSGATLGKIAREVRECTLCPLARGRTNAVPGEGSGRAGLVFIGEGPGAEEDAQGRPFVGRAGKLLDEALEAAGLRRKHVYITNVVKCRPPGNRPPRVGERKACVDAHLHRQLEVLKPRVICLLGNTAVQALLGRRALKEVLGRALEHGGHVFFATYHPAAALYNPQLKETIHGHMGLLAEILGDPQAFVSRPPSEGE